MKKTFPKMFLFAMAAIVAVLSLTSPLAVPVASAQTVTPITADQFDPTSANAAWGFKWGNTTDFGFYANGVQTYISSTFFAYTAPQVIWTIDLSVSDGVVTFSANPPNVAPYKYDAWNYSSSLNPVSPITCLDLGTSVSPEAGSDYIDIIGMSVNGGPALSGIPVADSSQLFSGVQIDNGTVPITSVEYTIVADAPNGWPNGWSSGPDLVSLGIQIPSVSSVPEPTIFELIMIGFVIGFMSVLLDRRRLKVKYIFQQFKKVVS